MNGKKNTLLDTVNESVLKWLIISGEELNTYDSNIREREMERKDNIEEEVK